MVTKIGNAHVGPVLWLVDDDEVAAKAAERDDQQLVVARRLVARPELGITSVTVCGQRDTYVVEAPPLPTASAAETLSGIRLASGTLWRRIADRSTASA